MKALVDASGNLVEHAEDVALALFDRQGNFVGYAGGDATGSMRVRASAEDSESVTPNDNTVLDFKALYVGTGGTVIIKHAESGAIKTFTNVQDGSILPVAGVRVMAATTATGIMALRW